MSKTDIMDRHKLNFINLGYEDKIPDEMRVNYSTNDISSHIYFILMVLLAMSLPLSVFSTSVTEILLLLNWIIEGNLRGKLSYLKRTKSILIISSLYLFYIAGLMYTSDFGSAFHSLKIKLPLLVLPIIIGTSTSFSYKELKIILLAFISGTLIGSFFSASIFFNVVPYEYTDIRQISIFISHIRFSLMIVLSVFILIYFIFSDKQGEFSAKWWKIFYGFVGAWLICFLFILKSFTGLVIFGICLFLVLWNYSGKLKDITPRFIMRLLLITTPLLGMSWITKSIGRFYHRETIDFSALETCTSAGNSYFHDTISNVAENGHYVWIYISENELKQTWNELSDYDYDGTDKRGQEIKYTLIRYLSSKGLRKDDKGLRKLTEEDITAIENGLTNYIFLNPYSLYPRIYEIIWEIDQYLKGKEPGDHSVSQRILYFKAAFSVFLKFPVFGSGTGDVTCELNKYYELNVPLMPDNLRKPAHNQYITILMTFGIVGFIFSIIAIFMPVFMEKKWDSYFVRIFFLIMFLSMLSDDTLETQTGISLFMFFYAVLIFGYKSREHLLTHPPGPPPLPKGGG